MYKLTLTTFVFAVLFPLSLLAFPADSTTAWNYRASLEQSPTCTHSNDAILRITGVPGFSPALYSIDGEYWQNSSVFKNISPGNYQPRILFEDGNLVKLAPLSIGAPNPIQLSSQLLTDSLSGLQTLELKAEGGNGEIWFSLDGGELVPENHFKINGPGKYIVIAEDEQGCFARKEFRLGGI